MSGPSPQQQEIAVALWKGGLGPYIPQASLDAVEQLIAAKQREAVERVKDIALKEEHDGKLVWYRIAPKHFDHLLATVNQPTEEKHE